MTNRTLAAIPFDGLNAESLGNYLAGLGLLAATSQRWPGIRGCWRDRRFVILTHNEIAPAAITSFLANEWKPTPYERWWTAAQKADTKAKACAGVLRERSQRSASEVKLLDAHIVGIGRNCFNPVLGTGGNIGKRDLAKACKDAAKLLSRPASLDWLTATLSGNSSLPMPPLSNGGTWFVFANKTFNSGQAWYRDGQMSPWSLLLAMEGALLLVGGVNRRFGSRARPYAVFPFISDPSQPETDGAIAVARAEFWAPLWKFPATLHEVRSLFERGLAKLGGRAAQAPHEFAMAALGAGVDAGIEEFARFELRQTTSSQVYEAIPRERVSANAATRSESKLLMGLIESGWIDRLPYEPRDSKQKGKFVGLRGPIESAIIRIAERPNDPDRWQHLLMRLAYTQNRIDRNKQLRERCIPIPPLNADWFRESWPQPTLEVEIARAVASVGWYSDGSPLIANVFGLQPRWFRDGHLTFSFPKARTGQAVCGPGDPLQVMLDIVHRRLIDASDSHITPLAGTRTCSASLINRFLLGTSVDLEAALKWLPPLSLIDWASRSAFPTSQCPTEERYPVSDGTTLLHALVRPFFHCDRRRNLIVQSGKPLFHDDQLPKAELLRRLFQLIRFGSVDEAVQVMRDRYLSLGHAIVMPPSNPQADGERIAAALLIPMNDRDVAAGLRRWLQPNKNRES